MREKGRSGKEGESRTGSLGLKDGVRFSLVSTR